MKKRTISLITTALLGFTSLFAQPADYTWTAPSANASESMPCGGGDIGLNVWVEGNDLLFYLCRSGAYDEHNTLLKQGRIRLRMGEGNAEASFRQTLRLSSGAVEVQLQGHTIRLWVDVFHPVIHVETESPKAVEAQIAYENWRWQDRPYRKNEGRQNSLKWSSIKNVVTSKDSIREEHGTLTFFHQNPAQTVFDTTVAHEGMEAVKDQLWNPLAHLVSGGRLQGEALTFEGCSEGVYADTDYRAWNFRTARKAKRHHFQITLHIDQQEDAAVWERGLAATEAAVRLEKDRKASVAWWQQFWQRSCIEAEGDFAEVSRNYTLFRYMLGCNAYGKEPTKFNGGLFTFDPKFVTTPVDFTPDYRNWGGGTMTAQNQRLVYWPMLKSGDFDLMPSQLQFYLRMLPNAECRSRFYWGHAGGCFSEQIEQFGLPNFVEYGLKRPEWFDKGMEYNAWLEYEWDTVLEFCQMALDRARYANASYEEYQPLIESALTFFDEHYQYLASRRGAKRLTAEGKLILFPGSGCETYKMALNAASTVAALQTVLKSYIAVKEERGDTATYAWKQLLNRIPALPLRTLDGKEMIAPAVSWERINNVESPQLYPVFPWRIYRAGMSDKDSLQVALNTYQSDPDALKFRSSKGWKQDNIWAACLGLTDEAVRLNKEKLANGPHRFPAFWGPGFDWTPDHNWGGSGMIGLQEMLLQAEGDEIHLFPAWPSTENVHFKLHAPENTVVEATLQQGKLTQLIVTPASRRAQVVLPDWVVNKEILTSK